MFGTRLGGGGGNRNKGTERTRFQAKVSADNIEGFKTEFQGFTV